VEAHLSVGTPQPPREIEDVVADRYFGRFHSSGMIGGVFGDPGHPRGDQGDIITYMVKFAWT